MKPTKEQIGKLLVWCEFEYRFVDTWLYPDGSYGSIPDIDSLEFLGFLFKYAVPKLETDKDTVMFAHPIKSKKYYCEIIDADGEPVASSLGHKDPALALFWAFDKIREENNVSKVS